MRTLAPRTCLVALAVAITLGSTVRAQNVIDGRNEIDYDRPESWAMKYFASIALPSGLGAVRSMEAGEIDVALELGWVPTLSDDQRRVGFNGRKLEELNRTSVFARPSARFGVGGDFSLELGWVPPLEIDGAKPDLVYLALGRPFPVGQHSRIGVRLWGQHGKIEGDFTCDKDTVAAGDDPVRNPFHCLEPSRDEHKIRSLGAAAIWARRVGDSPWEPHAGLGISSMDLEFEVDARYADLIDRTTLATDGTTPYVVGGLSYVQKRLRWTLEAFYAPLEVLRPPRRSSENDDLFNVRAQVSFRVR